MKTMCPPGYHHNGFVATHALGHMMYREGSLLYIYIRVSQIGSTGGGDNLGKMAKNCMKMTKSAFWGQNSRGDKPIFRVVWGISLSPPH